MDQIKKSRRGRKPKNMNRSKEIMRSLGLDVKKTQDSEIKHVKTSVDIEIEKLKAKYSNHYDKVFNIDDFKIKKFNDTYGFTHKDWKGVYCLGGDSRKSAKMMIDTYCRLQGKDVPNLHLM